jgi:hypothetical protein
MKFQQPSLNKLPEDAEWVGAIAFPDGYAGHAHVANVYRRQDDQLVVCSLHGRYRIQDYFFDERRISSKPLANAPVRFNPA